MSMLTLGRLAAFSILALVLASGQPSAAELNPAAVTFTLPDNVQWQAIPGFPGAQRAVMVDDPSKPGFYAVMVKCLAGNHFSRPHFHPHDRFIAVLKGVWWVGSGRKFDTDATVPMPSGAFVTHYGQQVHFDGAKDEDAVLLIVGDGPETPTPAEDK